MTRSTARSKLLLPGLPWIVFLLGLLISIGLWFDARKTHEESQQLTLELHLGKLHSAIEARLRAHEQILRGVAGLFAASQEVHRETFRRYAESLDLATLYPGIQGVGFARLIFPAQMAEHVAMMRAQGFDDYTVHPESNEAFQTGVVFFEPFDWHRRRVLGYDMFSDEVRRSAMAQARDTGKAVLSGRVRLQPETDEEGLYGAVLYYPVYLGGREPESLEERRNQLIGWAYLALRMQPLLDSLFSHEFDALKELVGLTVLDLGVQGGGLLYRSSGQPVTARELHGIQEVALAGRRWQLAGWAKQAFLTAHADHRATILLACGFAISLLLAFSLSLLARKERRMHAMHQALEQSRNELRNIYDTTSAGIFMLDRRGHIAHANRYMATMFSCSLEQLVGKSFDSLFVPEERELARQSLSGMLHGKRSAEELERRFQRFSAHDFVGRIAMRTLPGGDGLVHGIVGVISDITQQRLNELELRIAAIAFASNEAMVVTDAEARVVKVNRAFSELTGYREEEVIGQRIGLLSSGRHSHEFYENMWHEILARGSWQGEIWNRRKDGTVYPEWQTITAVRDEAGRTTHYVSSGFDISRRVALDTEMRNLAFYDPLTGLANRRLFNDRLQHAFAKSARSRKLGAVIFIDLDRFKELNDQLGHAEGDLLLQQVAERLNHCVREGDTVARLGGDEFVMLLEDLGEDHANAAGIARQIAESLRSALGAPYPQQAKMPAGWRCTASIGLALYCDGNDTASSVIERADKALYAAKSAGRNAVRMDGEAA